MNIRTIESDYDYRMQNVMKEMFESFNELKELSCEELQDKIWEKDYAIAFAHMVLEDMQDWSGDELFTKELYS